MHQLHLPGQHITGAGSRNSSMNCSYWSSTAARSHAADHDPLVTETLPGGHDTWASPSIPAVRSTSMASASRSGCGLIHKPAPSDPNPAQLSRLRTTCRARRSLSGMRAYTSSQRPSQSAAGPVNE